MRRSLFDDSGDYVAFEGVLAEAMKRSSAPELFAYCLMPNHWHLLVRPRCDGDLSSWMHWLTVTHAQRWHAHRGTHGHGHLYQGRFKSFPVQTDEHFLTVARYVERNALRAALLAPGEGADRWRWCSLSVRRRGPAAMQRLLSPWPIPRPADWDAWVTEPQTAAELDSIRQCVVRGRPFGGDEWCADVIERLDLHSTVRGRGRQPACDDTPTIASKTPRIRRRRLSATTDPSQT